MFPLSQVLSTFQNYWHQILIYKSPGRSCISTNYDIKPQQLINKRNNLTGVFTHPIASPAEVLKIRYVNKNPMTTGLCAIQNLYPTLKASKL